MKTIAIIFILCITDTFASRLTPEQIETIQSYEKECLMDTQAALDSNSNDRGFDVLVGETRCFSFCIFKKFGFMSDDGVFQETKFREFQVSIQPTKLDLMINDCSSEVGSDYCDTANKLFYCLAKYENLF